MRKKDKKENIDENTSWMPDGAPLKGYCLGQNFWIYFPQAQPQLQLSLAGLGLVLTPIIAPAPTQTRSKMARIQSQANPN